MKRILSLVLVACILFTLCAPALAAHEGEARAVIGADLADSQILTVYEQFGVIRGSVTELRVTNAEERDYLEGLVSESVIGTRSISCVYIKMMEDGEGLSVITSNISWCTEDMYRSALMTAGIDDAVVKVGAPFSVSGTAALTGIYKAYEDITGVTLTEEAKEVAADELITTAELAEEIDEEAAVAIVNELKLMLDEIGTMSDEELETQIRKLAEQYGYTLDEALVQKLISLCRSLQGLSVEELQQKARQFKDTLETVSQYAGQAVGFGQKVIRFIQNIVSVLKTAFGGE